MRDPRNVLVSAYFHHLDGHPVDHRNFYWPLLGKIRKELKQMSMVEGMMRELETITGKVLSQHFTCLPGTSDIQTMKLEDASLGDRGWLCDIAKHLDIEFSSDAALSIGDTQPNTTVDSPRDWKLFFNDEIKQVFKARYSRLLVDFGYEACED